MIAALRAENEALKLENAVLKKSLLASSSVSPAPAQKNVNL
jgi:hypothetical protein